GLGGAPPCQRRVESPLSPQVEMSESAEPRTRKLAFTRTARRPDARLGRGACRSGWRDGPHPARAVEPPGPYRDDVLLDAARLGSDVALWARGGHFYFGGTGHLHFGPTRQRLIRDVMSTFWVVGQFESVPVARASARSSSPTSSVSVQT